MISSGSTSTSLQCIRHQMARSVICTGYLQTFLVPTRNLAHQLHLQEAENQTLSQMIVSQIQQKLDALQTFELEQSDGLSKLRDSILHLTKEQQQALENSQEGYHGMDKTLSRYKQVNNITLFFRACFLLYS